MAWERKRQALEEEGRKEVMVGSAREGKANFQVVLEWASQGNTVAQKGKEWAWEAIGKLLEGQERDEG